MQSACKATGVYPFSGETILPKVRRKDAPIPDAEPADVEQPLGNDNDTAEENAAAGDDNNELFTAKEVDAPTADPESCPRSTRGRSKLPYCG